MHDLKSNEQTSSEVVLYSHHMTEGKSLKDHLSVLKKIWLIWRPWWSSTIKRT